MAANAARLARVFAAGITRTSSGVIGAGSMVASGEPAHQNRDSQILATPFILADENEENRIEILETRYVQNTTVQSNQTTLSSQQGEPAGITMSMVPTITDAQKTVLLSMALTVSEFDEDSPATSSLPPKVAARVTSSMTVPNGTITVIGGLSRRSRAEAEASDKKNLYVFLRAHARIAQPGR